MTYLKVQGTDWPDAAVPEPGNVGAYEVLDESFGTVDVRVALGDYERGLVDSDKAPDTVHTYDPVRSW